MRYRKALIGSFSLKEPVQLLLARIMCRPSNSTTLSLYTVEVLFAVNGYDPGRVSRQDTGFASVSRWRYFRLCGCCFNYHRGGIGLYRGRYGSLQGWRSSIWFLRFAYVFVGRLNSLRVLANQELQVSSITPATKMLQYYIPSRSRDIGRDRETFSRQSQKESAPEGRQQHAMRYYCDRVLVRGGAFTEEWEKVLLEEYIGSICHGLSAFNIDETHIVFVLVAM